MKYLILKLFLIFMANFILSFKAFSDLSHRSKIVHFEEIYKKLELVSIDGKKLELPLTAKGDDSPIVVINFWASWCIPCLEEIPSMALLTKKFDEKKLLVIAINTDKEDQLIKINKTKAKLKIPEAIHIVADKDYKIADLFKFEAIPVTIFYRNGKVVQFSNGPVNFDPKAKEIPKELWE